MTIAFAQERLSEIPVPNTGNVSLKRDYCFLRFFFLDYFGDISWKTKYQFLLFNSAVAGKKTRFEETQNLSVGVKNRASGNGNGE